MGWPAWPDPDLPISYFAEWFALAATWWLLAARPLLAAEPSWLMPVKLFTWPGVALDPVSWAII